VRGVKLLSVTVCPTCSARRTTCANWRRRPLGGASCRRWRAIGRPRSSRRRGLTSIFCLLRHKMLGPTGIVCSGHAKVSSTRWPFLARGMIADVRLDVSRRKGRLSLRAGTPRSRKPWLHAAVRYLEDWHGQCRRSRALLDRDALNRLNWPSMVDSCHCPRDVIDRGGVISLDVEACIPRRAQMLDEYGVCVRPVITARSSDARFNLAATRVSFGPYSTPRTLVLLELSSKPSKCLARTDVESRKPLREIILDHYRSRVTGELATPQPTSEALIPCRR